MGLQLAMIMLINAVELAVINTMICAKLPKRQAFRSKLLLCGGLAAAYIALMLFVQPGYLIVHIPLIAIAFVYVWRCYETNFQQALYIGIAAYTIQRISSLLNTLVTYFAPQLFAHDIDTGINAYGYMVIILCDIIVFGAFYFLHGRYFGVPELKKNATLRVVLIGIIVVLMNQPWTFSMLHTDVAAHIHSSYALADTIWNAIACILSLFIQFDIMHLDKKDTELEVTRKIISEKERQYKMSKSTVDAINRKCHDLKYQLSALSREGNGQKHIAEAMELVDSFESQIHTGNDTLDIIFTEKNDYCKKHEIDFVCMIDGDKLSFMDVTDLYVLFGNIIDNAINAVRKIEDHAERSIYVRIYQEKKLVLIQTENPFVGRLEFLDGLPRTTTGDEFNHGFGMSSIRMIAEKYGGSVNTRAENGLFYLNIVIPVLNKEETK